MLWYIYYNQRLCVIPFIARNVSTIRLLCLPQVTTFDLRLLSNYDQINHFGACLIAKLFYSVHKKLRTCGADFKYYKVANLRLLTSRITKMRTCGCRFKNPETSLRTCDCRFKNPETSLRTCGCGLSC